MDNKKSEAAVAAEIEREQAVTTGETWADAEAASEETLVVKLAKPYKFEGKEYTEIDLSGLETATAADLAAVGKIMTKLGIVTPMPEMTMDFSQHMAARVTRLPVEFFHGLPAREAIRLKNTVTGFLYGGDGDN